MWGGERVRGGTRPIRLEAGGLAQARSAGGLETEPGYTAGGDGTLGGKKKGRLVHFWCFFFLFFFFSFFFGKGSLQLCLPMSTTTKYWRGVWGLNQDSFYFIFGGFWTLSDALIYFWRYSWLAGWDLFLLAWFGWAGLGRAGLSWVGLGCWVVVWVALFRDDRDNRVGVVTSV